MKMAIFDCFSGASGNMIVSALLDIVLDENDLKHVIDELNLDIDFQIKDVSKNGIKAKLLEVKEKKKNRSFEEIERIIASSDIDEKVKKESTEMFKKLAIAEGKIHGRDYRKAIFHEVGSDDAIFDIVSSAIGMLRLKNEGYRIFTTPVYTGKGFVVSEHGEIPVPAPATLEVIKGSRIKWIMDGEGELLTPTGAVILSHFSEGEPIYPISIENISYGAGSRDTERPNLLRLILGKAYDKDCIAVVETNIDDMSGEDLAYAVEKLSKISHDVSIIPCTGKKGRPAWILKAITAMERAEDVAEMIMFHTSSLGVRIIPVYHRMKSFREEKRIKIRIDGKDYDVNVKISDYHSKPEFEDLKRVSEKTGLSIEKVREKVEDELDEA